jgi:hypothetical protein
MSYPGSPPPEPPYQPGATPVPPFQPGPAPVPPQYGTTPLPGPAMSGPPMSGPPLSGPPLSGPPFAGMPPYGYPTTGVPAPAKRSPIVPILAGLAALFFLMTAVFTTLYITKSSSANRTISLRNKTISSYSTQINDLKTQLQSTKDQLNDAQQRQSGTQNQLDEVAKEKQVISNCLNLYQKVVNALLNNDKATFDANFNDMKSACDEAAKYVS